MRDPEYSYCETIAAYVMHVRPLTKHGFKPSGGADTLALCGAKALWDLEELTKRQGVGPTAPAWQGVCRTCRKKFEEVLHAAE